MHQIITLEQVLGPHLYHPAADATIRDACRRIAEKVNHVCLLAEADGVSLEDDPDTGNAISGSRGGSGGGGWRPPEAVAIVRGAHFNGDAIDRADARRVIMQWCLTHKKVLEELDLYMEHPQWTSVWCHFQDVAPGSGSRWFVPYRDMKKYPPTCVALPEQIGAGVRVFEYTQPAV